MDETEFWRVWGGLTHNQRRYAVELTRHNTKRAAAVAAGIAPNTAYALPPEVERCAAYLQAHQVGAARLAAIEHKVDVLVRMECAMNKRLCVGADCGAGEELPMPAYDDYDGLRRWHAALGEGGGALAVQQDEQGEAIHATVKEMRAYILLHYPIWDRGLLDQMTRQQLTALYETLGGPPDVGELEMPDSVDQEGAP